MHRLFLNSPTIFLLSEAECLFYLFNSTLFASVIFTCLFLYRLLRPRLPARVNCWFCNRSFLVPYNDRNCFDCRFCDQYNGFNAQGDYNVDVLRRSKKDKNVVYSEKTAAQSSEVSNGLCKSCNVNQQLKVQQLANFTPMNDKNYDAEIEHFSQQLEKCYRLCDACELTLTQKLQAQNYNLLTQRLNGHCPNVNKVTASSNFLNKHKKVLDSCSVVIMAALQGYSIARHFEDHIKVDLSNLWIGGREMSALGAIFSLSGLLSQQNRNKRNYLCLAIWCLVHCAAWTNNTLALLLTTSLGVLAHLLPQKQKITFVAMRATPDPRNPPVTLNTLNSKKAEKPRKPSPPPQQTPVESVSTPLVAEKVSAPVTVSTPVLVEKRTEEPEPPSRVETRSQTAKKVPERNKRSRMFSPPPEVYDGMNGLRLSSPEPEPRKREKPANYLFESLHVDTSKSKSLIQPAKFHANRNTPSPYQGEVLPNTPCAQNSSTPCEVLPVTDYALSPITSKFSSPNSYQIDYDYNPYPPHPGFYPMPMGHTAVYTYARPASYPYSMPFSPMRFSPPFASPCEPSFSPRFSDVSQEERTSFSSLQVSQKWVWARRALYGASIVLNALTVGYILYSFLRG